MEQRANAKSGDLPPSAEASSAAAAPPPRRVEAGFAKAGRGLDDPRAGAEDPSITQRPILESPWIGPPGPAWPANPGRSGRQPGPLFINSALSAIIEADFSSHPGNVGIDQAGHMSGREKSNIISPEMARYVF